jgi:hypothetical protein
LQFQLCRIGAQAERARARTSIRHIDKFR